MGGTENPDYTDLDCGYDLKLDRLEDLNVNGNKIINGLERNYNGIIDTN